MQQQPTGDEKTKGKVDYSYNNWKDFNNKPGYLVVHIIFIC